MGGFGRLPGFAEDALPGFLAFRAFSARLISGAAALRAAIAAVQPGDSRASFGELARYLRTLSEGQKMPLEVHLASDLQKSAMPPGFADLRLAPAPEPLLAPPEGKRWQTAWSSEDPAYGGNGTPELDTDDGWRIPGEATVLLIAVAEE